MASDGDHKFVPEQGKSTNVMSYTDSITGPVLRIPQGVESSIVFENQLKDPSTIHWHGLRINNMMDGVPGKTQELVQPGKTFNGVGT